MVILLVKYVEQKPKGLSEKTTKLYSKNNSNGISIVEVDSVSTGIGTTFTCTLTTPPLNFSSDPFKTGDKVFRRNTKSWHCRIWI